MALMLGGGFRIVNPPGRMDMRLRVGIVLPLVPGFPLFGGWLVKGLIVLGSTHRGPMYHDGSSDAPTMQGGEWPVRGQGRHDLDHRLVVVHLVDVERMSVG